METVGITVAATHIEGQNLKYIVFVCVCVYWCVSPVSLATLTTSGHAPL